MKKISFNILSIRIINKKLHLKVVEGYQIDSVAGVYRERPYWYVTEFVSGTCICKGKTKQEALDNYEKIETKEKIKNAHKTDIYKHLKNIFEEMKGEKLNDNTRKSKCCNSSL